MYTILSLEHCWDGRMGEARATKETKIWTNISKLNFYINILCFFVVQPSKLI
jgi:hypothetical protein